MIEILINMCMKSSRFYLPESFNWLDDDYIRGEYQPSDTPRRLSVPWGLLRASEAPRTSQHYGIWSLRKPLEHRSTMAFRGLWKAPDWDPVMPRATRLSDSRCNIFQLGRLSGSNKVNVTNNVRNKESLTLDRWVVDLNKHFKCWQRGFISVTLDQRRTYRNFMGGGGKPPPSKIS